MPRQPDLPPDETTLDELRSQLADAERAEHYRQGVVYAMQYAHALRSEIKRREQLVIDALCTAGLADLKTLIAETAEPIRDHCPGLAIVGFGDAPAMVPQQAQLQQAQAGASTPSDYSVIPNGRHYAVTRCGLIVPGFEEIDSYGDAEHHIEDLEDADRIEAEEEAAAVADFHAELAAEDRIDAYHEGYFAHRGGDSLPYDPGPLADAWKDGKRDAQRDRRRIVAAHARPEGYYHSRPEAL